LGWDGIKWMGICFGGSAAERTAKDSQDIWGGMAQGFMRRARSAARPDF
jgi:hypothetical protein